MLFCEQTALVGELMYIGTYAIPSLGVCVGYIVCPELVVHLLLNKPGMAGGIFPFFTGVGSLVITQIIIALRNVFREHHINAGTTFICIRIFIAVVTAPCIPVLRFLQDFELSVDNKSTGTTINLYPRWKNAWTVLKAPRTWLVSVVTLCGFIPSFAILMYQEPIVVSLWNTAHPPVTTLSAIVMLHM